MARSIASLRVALARAENANLDDRPHKQIRAKSGTQEWALYDTGAAITAANEEFFNANMRSGARRLPDIDKLMCITAANGERLSTEGCYETQVWMDGRWLPGAFFVVKGLSSPLILGIDFIKRNKLDFHASTGEVTIEEDSSQMRTCKETRIPAGSMKMVKVRAADLHCTPGEVLVASIDSRQVPICGSDMIIGSEGTCHYVMVDNVMDVELTIPRGTVIGAVEIVRETECKEIKLEEEQAPKEKPRPKEPCDREKGAMLKEVLKEQMANLDPKTADQYMQVILRNHDVFSRDKADLGRTTVMEHKIRLKEDSPAYAKQFRIPEEHRSILIEHLRTWLKLGVVSPCKSHWNSPIFLVPKKDGTMRPVLDFRQVNIRSHVDKYSQREIQDCIDEIGRSGSTVFSSLDLTAGFWQLPLAKESREMTAFTIPGMGSYCWNMTPMGLLGSPATFGRMMDFIMRFLQVIAYQDDLLVHSKTHEEQVKVLEQCFARLRANGLKLNAKKCAFGQPEIPYLGYTLTEAGILPGKDKTQAIRDSPPPRTPRQVREFTGLCNYFRASIKDFANLAAPLNRLLTKEAAWKGGELPEEALSAYRDLKEALMNPPVLAYPNPRLDYHLVVDASLGLQGAPGGLGASLIQIDEQGIPRAVGFASRGLSKHERNYSAYLAELSACVFGIEYFQVYLKGRQFYLYTDHRPMEKLSSTHTRTLNRLQQLMSEYNFVICYKPGRENCVADYLSRNPLSAIDMAGKDLNELQKEDHEIREVMERKAKQQGTDKLLDRIFSDKGIVFFKKPEGGRAIYAPTRLRAHILQAAHNSRVGGHMGVFKSRERILGRYFWPGLEKDLKDHIRACQECQRSKPWNRPNKAPLQPLEQPVSPNHRIHIDLFGPLATSGQGKKMICVITDAFTKYTELVAVRSKEAGEVAKAIMDTWITRYSTPKEIVTDGGKEFANKLMEAICQELSILHKQTSPYHPETNASAEVFNRTMKLYLATALDQNKYLDWEDLLPALRICYNTSVSKATRATPFSLVFGMDANMPFFDLEKAIIYDEKYPELLANLKAMREKAAEANLVYRKKYKEYYDKAKKAVSQEIAHGEWIWVENTHKVGPNPKFHPAFLGPFKVVETKGLNIYYQDKKKIKVAHMNRVKKAIVKEADSGIDSESEAMSWNLPSQSDESFGTSGAAKFRKSKESVPISRPDSGPINGSNLFSKAAEFSDSLAVQNEANETREDFGSEKTNEANRETGHVTLSDLEGEEEYEEESTHSEESESWEHVSAQAPERESERGSEGERELVNHERGQRSTFRLEHSPGQRQAQAPERESERGSEGERELGNHEREQHSTFRLEHSPVQRQGEENREVRKARRRLDETILPNSPFPPTPAFIRNAMREHARMDTDERSHIYHNDVELREENKRKSSSPLKHTNTKSQRTESRVLRSAGPVPEVNLPDRPVEYKTYAPRKTQSKPGQSSERE